jgi:ketosteroid isomerase-like protein
VRAVDFAAARQMFAEDVVGFGTYATVVAGRAALERRQWAHIWPAIRGFKFRLDQVRCLGGPQGVCVVVPWESRGVREDGTTFARPGRATLFLVPAGGRWIAQHSHFSLAPARAPRARRRG